MSKIGFTMFIPSIRDPLCVCKYITHIGEDYFWYSEDGRNP